MAVAPLTGLGARSLSTRLGLVWALTLTSALVVGWLLVGLYRQSADARIGEAARVLVNACDDLAQRHAFYVAGWTPEDEIEIDDRLRRDLDGVARVALFRFDGVEGGIWSQTQGPLAGSDPVGALAEQIRALDGDVISDGRAGEARFPESGRIVLLRVCPLTGPISGLVAWTATRVRQTDGPIDPTLAAGLAALAVTVLGSAGLLTQLLLTWSRRLGRIEASLARHADAPLDDLPRLALTGERELDRIVTALNEAGARLAQARETGAALARQAADAERLAALGRVAAGLAHEIRNPIAAMRLKAENALAKDDARRREALEIILKTIDRLDRLLGDLLRLTHRTEPSVQTVDLPEYLEQVIDSQRDLAERAGVALSIGDTVARADFDPEQIARALGNLVLNAIQNTPPGGAVALAAEARDDRLILSVTDTGRGVPEAIRPRLFEPFVTGRAEGTGLGLSIAREIAEAHGGLAWRDTAWQRGTRMVLELPWRPS